MLSGESEGVEYLTRKFPALIQSPDKSSNLLCVSLCFYENVVSFALAA